jgi:hypothetical protein
LKRGRARRTRPTSGDSNHKQRKLFFTQPRLRERVPERIPYAGASVRCASCGPFQRRGWPLPFTDIAECDSHHDALGASVVFLDVTVVDRQGQPVTSCKDGGGRPNGVSRPARQVTLCTGCVEPGTGGDHFSTLAKIWGNGGPDLGDLFALRIGENRAEPVVPHSNSRMNAGAYPLFLVPIINYFEGLCFSRQECIGGIVLPRK